MDLIQKSLGDANFKLDDSEFEIAEGALTIGKSYTDDALHEFHKLSVKLSMDDFGTGYSSLSYLRKCSFGVLKID